MTRPTTSQIDAYCAALKAHLEGERVEFRTLKGWEPIVDSLQAFGAGFPSFDSGLEYRITLAPPKLREVWLYGPTLGAHQMSAWTTPPPDRHAYVRFREVSETADAEIAEKLRNHDALCRAIDDMRSFAKELQPVTFDQINRALDANGAKLQ